jgi:hypothetical protein
MSSHYSPSFLEERRVALDAYMQRLLVSKRGRERREGGREGRRKEMGGLLSRLIYGRGEKQECGG